MTILLLQVRFLPVILTAKTVKVETELGHNGKDTRFEVWEEEYLGDSSLVT